MKKRSIPEIKERAARLLTEAKNVYPSTWAITQAIASNIGCSPEILQSWYKR